MASARRDVREGDWMEGYIIHYKKVVLLVYKGVASWMDEPFVERRKETMS